jgi:hypothetical protein
MDHRCKCSEKLRSSNVMGAAAGQGCHINDIERRHFNRIAPAVAGAHARASRDAGLRIVFGGSR